MYFQHYIPATTTHVHCCNVEMTNRKSIFLALDQLPVVMVLYFTGLFFGLSAIYLISLYFHKNPLLIISSPLPLYKKFNTPHIVRKLYLCVNLYKCYLNFFWNTSTLFTLIVKINLYVDHFTWFIFPILLSSILLTMFHLRSSYLLCLKIRVKSKMVIENLWVCL